MKKQLVTFSLRNSCKVQTIVLVSSCFETNSNGIYCFKTNWSFLFFFSPWLQSWRRLAWTDSFRLHAWQRWQRSCRLCTAFVCLDSEVHLCTFSSKRWPSGLWRRIIWCTATNSITYCDTWLKFWKLMYISCNYSSGRWEFLQSLGNYLIYQQRQHYNNPLNTKRRLLYLKTQFVPRSKHFSSRL